MFLHILSIVAVEAAQVQRIDFKITIWDWNNRIQDQDHLLETKEQDMIHIRTNQRIPLHQMPMHNLN